MKSFTSLKFGNSKVELTDKKKCSNCLSDFGLFYSNNTSTIKTDVGITQTDLFARLPIKIECGHKICNFCFDKFQTRSTCPICTKAFNSKAKISSLIDYEQFGQACYNTICCNQFRINSDVTEKNTLFSNENNRNSLEQELDRFVLKCSFCPERIEKENDENLELTEVNNEISNAQVFCFSCFTVYCERCYLFNHADLVHNNMQVGTIAFASVNCLDHKSSFIHAYCETCRIFVCSDCIVKYEHKRHVWYDFYLTETERNNFLSYWYQQLVRNRNSNLFTLNVIRNDFNSILPSNIPYNLIDKFLAKNKTYEMAKKLKKDISIILQSNSIIEVIGKILESYSCCKNNLLLKHVPNDLDTTFKGMLNEYSHLTSFNAYEPIRIDEENLISLEQFQIDELANQSNLSLYDLNNNNNNSINNYFNNNNNNNSLRLNNSNTSRSFSLQSIAKKANNESIQLEKSSAPLPLPAIIEPIIEKPKLVYEKIPFNVEHPVKVISYLTPSNIWLRLNEREELNNELSKSINKFYADCPDFIQESDFKEIKIGCDVAHYIEKAFKGWVRAKVTEFIMDVNEFQVKVLCYDWGVEETVSVKNLKKLDENFLSQPATAFHCYIHNIKPFSVEDENNNNINTDPEIDESIYLDEKMKNLKKSYRWPKYLRSHVYDWSKLPIAAKVYKIIEGDYFGVDLLNKTDKEMLNQQLTEPIVYKYRIEPTILSEMLVRCKLCSFEKPPKYFSMCKLYIPIPPFNANQKVIAGIAHFDTLNDFNLKLLDDYHDEIDKSRYLLDNKIQSEYNDESEQRKLLRIYEPYVGMPVAAPFTDKRWYRAEIIKIFENTCTVLIYFIDYGNTFTCSVSKLRYLKPEFLHYESPIFRCRLYGVKFLDHESYLKASDYFYKTVSQIALRNDKTMHVHIKRIELLENDEIKTMSLKTNRMHEVIIRYPIDQKMTNLNVYFTKIGYAQATDPCIFDGESDEKTFQVENRELDLKGKIKPTKMEAEANEVSILNPNKVILNDDASLNENRIHCKVLNAISPNEIWVQDAVDSQSYYEKFQKLINERYTELVHNKEVKLMQDLKPNDLCLLKTPRNRNYLRAKIVDKLLNGNFKVICLDIGFYEANVKSEYLYELISEFKNKPDYKAKKCSVIGVSPMGTENGKWSSYAKDYTSETLNDNFVYVSFKSEIKSDDSYDTVVYVDKNASTAAAAACAAAESQTENGTSSAQLVTFAQMLNHKGVAFLDEKKIQIENLLAKKISYGSPIAAENQPLMYLASKLSPNVKPGDEYYSCLITNVDTKTGVVSLRFLEPNQSFETTKQIQNDLAEFFDSTKPSNTNISYLAQFLSECLKKKIFQACVAKFNDGKYYRCEIVDIVEELNQSNNIAVKKYQVVDVDFGLEAKLTLDSIYRPMINHLRIERQVYKFQLNPKLLSELFTMPKFLSNVLKDKLVELQLDRIINDNNKNLLIIGNLNILHMNLWISELIASNSSLTKALRKPKETVPSYLPFRKPEQFLEMPHQIEISFVENYNIVWINLKSSEINLDKYTKLKQLNQLKNMSINRLVVERPCLCLYQTDLNIYRAEILSVDYLRNVAKVSYVDFGNTEEIDFADIYEIEPDHLKSPVNTLKCRLKYVKLNQTYVTDLKAYQDEVTAEITDCFDRDEPLYGVFSTPKNIEPDIEIYVNDPSSMQYDNSYLAYQSLIDKNRIEI